MRLTSKGRYAVRAMLDLTFHSNGNPVRLQEISTRQTISLHYLEQLFRRLRNGRVVKSVRGPGGGYVLGRAMDEISIKDILDCVGENTDPARDIIGPDDKSLRTVEFRLSRSYFENLAIIMQEYLETTSLGDLLRKAQGSMQDTQADANNTDEAKSENQTIIGDNNANANREEVSTPASGINLNSGVRAPIGEVNQ